MSDRQPTTDAPEVDERGVTLTPEGRERARRELAEVAARMTPEKWAELRAKFRPGRAA